MKKIISVLLVCVMLLPMSVFFAAAMPISSGTESLNGCFADGTASNGMSYVYFSPKKGDGDTEKYPLVIWLHGIGAAGKPRNQLTRYGLSAWASDEYQARFEGKSGFFVFAPLSQNAATAWDSTQVDALKSAIDGFISRFPNSIDTNRIYIAGFSLGACMVWSMLSAYPDFFAAAAPVAAIYQPTIDYSSIKDVAVWMFTCDRDSFAGGTTAASNGTFKSLKETSAKPSALRYTNVNSAKLPDNSSPGNQHYIWGVFCNDMHMNDGSVYVDSRTVDGLGNTVNLSQLEDGIISWLSLQSRDNTEQNSTRVGFWDKLVAFFRKIADFFANLFR